MDIQNHAKDYKSTDHLFYSCQYHVIFCPKYRRKILKNGIDTRLKELFVEIAETYDFQIIEMEIMSDHVHLLIDCNPRFGIMDCINKLKGITANRLRKEFPEIRKLLYGKHIWSPSYFISTVSENTEQNIKEYIKNQKRS